MTAEVVMVNDLPDDAIRSLLQKRTDALLAHLARETVFDVGFVNLLLTFGQQHMLDELQRRELPAQAETKPKTVDDLVIDPSVCDTLHIDPEAYM